MSVAELARKWVGTPYRHQASCRGAGADCLGLIRGVWRELYGHDLLVPLTYSADWAERRDDEPLWTGLTRWMVPCLGTRLTCGDVILFRMSTRAWRLLGAVIKIAFCWQELKRSSPGGALLTTLQLEGRTLEHTWKCIYL